MASRCIARLRPLWRHWLRAVFAAGALAYAAAILSADGLRSSAWRDRENHAASLGKVRLAGAVFPLDHRYRKGEAEFLSRVRWKGSIPVAIEATQRALRTDPYSMDLHRNLAGFFYEQGEDERAAAELAFIEHFLPGRQITIVVNANPATN